MIDKNSLRRIRFLVRQKLNEINNTKLLRDKNPVLVYQMGKVGSTSVYDALAESGLDALHIHGLSERMRSLIKTKEEVRVISLVREPVGRRISGFFQNLYMHTGRYFDPQQDDAARLAEDFLSRSEMCQPPTWFEDEFEPALGLDIYGTSFACEQGYQEYKQGALKILVLKVELEDTFKEAAIGAFLGIQDFKLKRSNVSVGKVYADAYREFVRVIDLPDEYLDRMYESSYAKHFYHQREIESFRCGWTCR